MTNSLLESESPYVRPQIGLTTKILSTSNTAGGRPVHFENNLCFTKNK